MHQPCSYKVFQDRGLVTWSIIVRTQGKVLSYQIYWKDPITVTPITQSPCEQKFCSVRIYAKAKSSVWASSGSEHSTLSTQKAVSKHKGKGRNEGGLIVSIPYHSLSQKILIKWIAHCCFLLALLVPNNISFQHLDR